MGTRAGLSPEQTTGVAVPDLAVFYRLWTEESYTDWFERWKADLDLDQPDQRDALQGERDKTHVEKVMQFRPDPRKGERMEGVKFFEAALELAKANGWEIVEGDWMTAGDVRAVVLAPLLKLDCFWAKLRRPKTSKERAL